MSQANNNGSDTLYYTISLLICMGRHRFSLISSLRIQDQPRQTEEEAVPFRSGGCLARAGTLSGKKVPGLAHFHVICGEL